MTNLRDVTLTDKQRALARQVGETIAALRKIRRSFEDAPSDEPREKLK